MKKHSKKVKGTEQKVAKKKRTRKEEVEEKATPAKGKGKKEERVINFKKAKKDFKIETKNASWKEIKALTNELLQTIKEFVWDVADDDAGIDELSEFLLVQILYHAVSSKVLDKVPGLYEAVCKMADRYPVVFDIE